MNNEVLVRQLMEHEDIKLLPYTDTKGKLTIGVGRNLTDVGISKAEAFVLLDTDIARAQADLDRAFPWWREMSEVRQRVLCDLCFNMGLVTLRTFERTMAAMARGDYAKAAVGMLSSHWAEQVGKRARRLAQMMATGLDVALADVNYEG